MIQVAAAIILQEDSVLVARRAVGQKLEGYWEFPGGKIEPGESPQDCIVRELAEELSVAARAGDEIARSNYVNESGSIELIAVEVQLESKEFTLSVHDKAEWVRFEKLLELKLAPADIAIAEHLIARASIL